MKKIVLFFALLAIAIMATAQIKVTTLGNVGIGHNTPTQKLHVVGNTRFNPSADSWKDIFIDATNQWGVPQIYSSDFLIGKSNVCVNGIWVNYLYYKYLSLVSSDETLKENIKPLENTLSKLLQIEGKSYNYKKDSEINSIPEFEEMLDKETFGFIAQELEDVFPELVYPPSAVNNYYSINYIGMIPVLLEAIKEQQSIIENLQREILPDPILRQGAEELQNIIEMLQQKVENLEETLLKCCQSNSNDVDESNNIQEINLSNPTDAMKVYQNAPNPFNERTTIKCYIPQSIPKAELCVYNMQGIQVKCFTVSERGIVNVQIEAGQLSAGIYTYLLVGNGKTSDTKQMILTK